MGSGVPIPSVKKAHRRGAKDLRTAPVIDQAFQALLIVIIPSLDVRVCVHTYMNAAHMHATCADTQACKWDPIRKTDTPLKPEYLGGTTFLTLLF